MIDQSSPEPNEQHILFSQDYTPHHQSAYEEPPQGNGFRALVSIILVLILIAGIGYSAVRPFILSMTETSTFQVDLRAVMDSQRADCTTVADDVSMAIASTNTLCVCGVVYAGGRRADEFELILRTDGIIIVEQARFFDTRSGDFCHRWELSERLVRGQYRLDVRREFLLDTYWFRVQSASSV